jgi:LPS sulfotransferase NodH
MTVQQMWWWILACVKSLMVRVLLHRNFLVLSSGRSGSTLLTQLLNSHPQVQCGGELLNREELKNHADKQSLSNYVLANLIPLKFGVSYTGFKLFNEQLEYSKLSFRSLLHDLKSPSLIILYRENLLETYVSLKIAFATNVWYSNADQETNQCRIEVNWEEFQEYVETERRRWQKSMSVIAGIDKVFVSFEDLVENQDTTMKKLLTFLKLREGNFYAWSRRQNPLPLSDKISNYKDIMAKIRDSGLSLTLTADWLKSAVL